MGRVRSIRYAGTGQQQRCIWLTVGILKQVSAFRLCCVQAYADGLAAKHFEQQNKITELERSSSVILFCCSKCLAKAEADAKAGSFGNFRPLRVYVAKLWNCLLDLKSPFEFRSLRMIDANLIFSDLSFANWLVNVFQFLKKKVVVGSWRR